MPQAQDRQEHHDMGSLLSHLFRLLEVSEFTIPSDQQFDQACHLCLRDNSVDSRDNPQMVRIWIKQSKMTIL